MSNEKETLWVISELFPPEETSTGYIMGEIANAMLQKYDVKVICGPEVYDEKKKNVSRDCNTIDKSIQLYRVAAVKENKDSKLSRMKKFLLMSWQIFKVAKKEIKKEDKVLMVSNPFPLIVLMGYLKKRREFNLFMLVHDIFPETLRMDMNIPCLIYRIAEKVFNNAYSRVDILISIGRDMKDILEEKCHNNKHRPRIVTIENWGDVDGIKPVERQQDGFIKIQYAGNIGNAQGVGELVEILYEAGNKTVLFGIWGTGSAEERIKARVKELGLDEQVKFYGPYSRSQQTEVLNDSDISLVTLVNGMYGLGVPSKTYNILAAGKPIIYIGEKNTEIWRTVEENQIGYCFEPDDKKGISYFLKSLNTGDIPKLKEMGCKARVLAESKYSESIILNKFKEAI
jgi:glycosyltransferase involved in cell wall biosynthesis